MARVVRNYSSADGSAPVITGEINTFNAAFHAIAVTGYGAATAAGWTREFNGTNKSAYRNSATDGTGRYLRIRDDYTSTNLKYATFTAYESMSDVDTGTNRIHDAVGSHGILKSNTQDNTARAWRAIGDNVAIHFLIQAGDDSTNWEYYFFGDFFSDVPSDAYSFTTIARYSASADSSPTNLTTNTDIAFLRITTTTSNTIRTARNHSGTVGGIDQGIGMESFVYGSLPSSVRSGAMGVTYPYPVGNRLLLSPALVHPSNSSPHIVRGYMPGLWFTPHSRPFANNDTCSGTGNLNGKTFEAFHTNTNSQIFIETSNTWS